MENRLVEGYRLSPQQKHLWLSQQTSRAQCMVMIEGAVQPEALKQAVQKVIDRHEILRTTFERLPGMTVPFQVVAERGTPTWHNIDLTGGAAPEQEAKLKDLFAEEGRRPFNSEQEAPVRLSLLALSPDKHALLISVPALCADAKTLQNLVSEISRLYAASVQGEELSDEPLQYADFSEWQHELLEAEDEHAVQGKDYWRSPDTASRPTLALPFEALLSPQTAYEPQSLRLEIDAQTSLKISAITGESEISEAAFWLACWQTLLWRLTGQSEVVVSTAYDGRKFAELAEALGLFAKLLPIRAHFGEGLSFADVLRQVDQTMRDAGEWQEYFAGEQRGEATADESHLPVSFEFSEQPSARNAAGVRFSIEELRGDAESFKIKLACLRRHDSLIAEMHYDPRIFQHESIQRMARCFETLVKSATENPAELASNLEILSGSDRDQLLIQFNQTATDYPQDKCIHDLFEEQVERTPNGVAVVFEDQQLTYAECNARANQLARVLRQRGVGADVPVGLCMERSVEMLVAMLGILKAGGAYVPLNPDHPKARLLQQLADTHSPVLLTQEKLLGQMPDFEGETLCLDRDQGLFESEAETNLESITAPQHLVYVIYTSGSTGVPKGVAITHRNLVNYTNFICEKLQLKESSGGSNLHFATVSTIGADLGNTCIFPSLVSGGCLHIISYEAAMDGGIFADYVAKHPIDVLKIVPSHLNALLASQESGEILPRRYLILGGEALSWELVKRISETSSQCRVINHYGPTETTVGSLTFSLSERDVSRWRPATVPVGRPIANTQVYILDQHLNPVPIGTPGQLYIGGAGVARGYLNQPEQTNERFIPHPFSTEPDARLYKTGDVVRYLPDGSVEFFGRTDYQVKIRGFRIELGEIEAVLRQNKLVREAIVLAREDEPGQQRLVAYVVAPEKTTATSGDLRNFLKEQLPDYMLPTSVVVLDALPLTPNGKVDRRALPAPEELRPESEAIHVAPQTEVEQTIATVWQEALRIERVGVNHNFFDLGGHSLLMVKVHNKLRAVINRELSIIDMFRYPTISSLANYLSEQQGEPSSVQPDLERAEMRREAMRQQRQARQERQPRRS